MIQSFYQKIDAEDEDEDKEGIKGKKDTPIKRVCYRLLAFYTPLNGLVTNLTSFKAVPFKLCHLKSIKTNWRHYKNEQWS